MRRIVFGTVTNASDPEQRGRIKASIPNLTARVTKSIDGKDIITFLEHPAWIEPSFPFAGSNFGYFFIPPIGSKIEIEMKSDVYGNYDNFRWRSALYSVNEPIPTEFTINYPRRMGIKTPAGILMMLDDVNLTFTLEGATIELGAEASTDPNFGHPLILSRLFLTLFNTLVTAFNSHTHLYAPGTLPTIPTGPPSATGSPMDSSHLSTRSFTK